MSTVYMPIPVFSAETDLTAFTRKVAAKIVDMVENALAVVRNPVEPIALEHAYTLAWNVCRECHLTQMATDRNAAIHHAETAGRLAIETCCNLACALGVDPALAFGAELERQCKYLAE